MSTHTVTALSRGQGERSQDPWKPKTTFRVRGRKGPLQRQQPHLFGTRRAIKEIQFRLWSARVPWPGCNLREQEKCPQLHRLLQVQSSTKVGAGRWESATHQEVTTLEGPLESVRPLESNIGLIKLQQPSEPRGHKGPLADEIEKHLRSLMLKQRSQGTLEKARVTSALRFYCIGDGH